MAEINDLIHQVMVSVTGAPEPLAVEAYRNAARQFFSETKLWRKDVDTFTSTLQSGEFTLESGNSDEEVFDISFSQHGSVRLMRSNLEKAYRTRTTGSGTPKYYAIKPGGVAVYAPAPNDASQLTALGIVRPTTDAMAISDDLVAEYHTVIEQGAMANLLAAPGQAWSSPELATYHQQNFITAIEDFLSRAVHAGTDDVPRRAPMITRGRG